MAYRELIASLQKTSLSRFKALFLEETGMTPMYYINWRKIAVAKRFLAQGKNITQTAMDLGFGNVAYFSSLFHNMTSRTPREYLRKLEVEQSMQRHTVITEI